MEFRLRKSKKEKITLEIRVILIYEPYSRMQNSVYINLTLMLKKLPFFAFVIDLFRKYGKPSHLVFFFVQTSARRRLGIFQQPYAQFAVCTSKLMCLLNEQTIPFCFDVTMPINQRKCVD